MSEQFRLGDGPAVAPARNGEGAPAASSNGANGRVSVTALSDGPLVTVLAVRDAEVRQKRNGEDFLQLSLGDSSGKVRGDLLGRRRRAPRDLRARARSSGSAASTRTISATARR